MQVAAEKNIVFWDRLKKLNRTKSSGEVVAKGSTAGLNVVRIRQGEGTGQFLTVHCIMQELLRANIKRWPSSVSEDGLSVCVWMDDFSTQQKGYRRHFELNFFDENSAQRFFDSFTAALPDSAVKGLNYYEMRFNKELEVVEEKGEENGNVKNDEKEVEEGRKESISLSDSEDDDFPSQSEVDAFLLEVEEVNIGESQSLFNPIPQNW